MDERSERVACFFQWPVFVAALLVVPLIVLEHDGYHGTPAYEILNWTTWGVFFIETAVLLVLARRRLHWVGTHWLQVAVVVLTPPILPEPLQDARVLRVLLLVRLARLAQLTPRVLSVEGVRFAAFLSLLTVLAGGTAFSAVERPDQKLSAWDGVWWAFTTMTTVGYGDISPRTTAGRLLGILLMVVGIAFVALLTAAVVQHFFAQEERDDIRRDDAILARLDEVSQRLTRLEQAAGVDGEAPAEPRRAEQPLAVGRRGPP